MSSRSVRAGESDPLLGQRTSDSGDIESSSATPAASMTQRSLTALGYIVNIAVHAAMVGFTAFVTYLSFGEGVILFAWHPTCMLIGFFVLMTEAILCFLETNVLTLGLSFTQRKKLHWILQAIAAVSITVAFTVVLLNKNRIGKPHFATNHGIVGLTAVICAGVSMLGGVAALYSFELRNVLPVRPVYVKLGHTVFSVCSYILAIGAIVLGLYTRFFEENTDGNTTIGCFVLVVAVGVYVLVWPAWKSAKRIRQLFNR